MFPSSPTALSRFLDSHEEIVKASLIKKSKAPSLFDDLERNLKEHQENLLKKQQEVVSKEIHRDMLVPQSKQ